MGWLSGIAGAIGGLAGKLLDPVGALAGKVAGGLFKKPDNSVAEAAAAKAKAEATAELRKTQDAQAQYQQSMLNMQKNSQQLSASNQLSMDTQTLSNVVVGGTAAENEPLKKKPVGAGIASSLGINV